MSSSPTSYTSDQIRSAKHVSICSGYSNLATITGESATIICPNTTTNTRVKLTLDQLGTTIEPRFDGFDLP